MTRALKTAPLALALSAGTLAGMFAIATLAGPASAQSGETIRANHATQVAAKTAAAAPEATAPAAPTKRAPRVVQIYGFENCSIIREVRSAQGGAPAYTCVR